MNALVPPYKPEVRSPALVTAGSLPVGAISNVQTLSRSVTGKLAARSGFQTQFVTVLVLVCDLRSPLGHVLAQL